MGQPLIIESLTIYTDSEFATYSYSPGVTAVAGPIGSGKSSMLELIKYGLGGRARVMPAIRDNVQRITLRIRIGTSHLELTRELKAHTIDVTDATTGERVGTWATTNRKNMPRVGEELLAAVGLPRDLRIPRRMTRPTAETVKVSFYDVYRYLYLDQNSIDNNVIGHNDPNLNIKRIAVFQLVYQLTSERIVELATDRGRLYQQAQHTREAARHVREFLAANDEPDPIRLNIQRQEAEEQLARAESRLRDLRTRQLRISPEGSLAREIAAARARLAELEDQAASLTRDIEKDNSVLAQLDLDEGAIKREESASQSLSGLEFACCPRCLQSLEGRAVGLGICLLCCQELPDHGERTVIDLKRIQDQRKETTGLLREDVANLEHVMAEIGSLRSNLAEFLIQEERRNAEPSSPVLDEVSDVSRNAAVAAARVQQIIASQGRWASYERLVQEADETEEIAARLKVEEDLLRLQLNENLSKVADLSLTFNDILSGLRDPWYKEAHVDMETYLPMVDNEPFDLLSVGGARKTLVNLAYHIANFMMSLSEGYTVLLPTLLIIDSPRKNVGEAALDRSVVEAVYRRLRALQDAMAHHPRGFQIIIADNEPPQSARAWLPKIIELDYEHPLVPGVSHPGEEVETIAPDSAEES
jgi:AAA domain